MIFFFLHIIERGFDVTKSGDTRIGLGEDTEDFFLPCLDSSDDGYTKAYVRTVLHRLYLCLLPTTFLCTLMEKCFTMTASL